MDKVFLQTLGKHIANLRKQKGISQEDFAELSGKMINTVSNIERGLTDPRISTLYSFANTLNISIQDLLIDTPINNISNSETLNHIISLLETQDDKTLKIILKQIEVLLEMK